MVKKIVPFVFAVICGYLVYGGVYRLLIHYPYVSEGICALDGADPARAKRKPAVFGKRFEFNTKTPCHDTGLTIEPWQKYKVEIDWNDPWQDLNTKAGIKGLEDLSDNFHPVFLAALPMRRYITKPWFILVGEVGADSGHVIPFNREEFTFTATARGRLQLYVNDAINAMGRSVPINHVKTIKSKLWTANYRNNTGVARITITLVE